MSFHKQTSTIFQSQIIRPHRILQ